MTTPTNTPTPRTDVIEADYFNSCHHADVRAVDAFKAVRTLERELDSALEHQEVPFHTCAGEKCTNKYCRMERENQQLQRELSDYKLANEKAINKVVELARESSHFKQLAEERWQMCEELASVTRIYLEASIDKWSVAKSALSLYHSLQQQKKDEKV